MNFSESHLMRLAVIAQHGLSEGEPGPVGVLWITNFPAPYRIPVWDALGETFRVMISVIVSPDSFSLDAPDRGREWLTAAIDEKNFSLQSINTIRPRKIRRPLHFLTRPSSIKPYRDIGCVVLGGWEEPVYWQLLIWAKLTGKSTVGFYESTVVSQTHKHGMVSLARRIFFRSLDAVVVPGRAAKSAVRGMGVPEERLFEGFNAVDVEAFNRARRTQVFVPSMGHKFVYVGRLIDLKNVPLIIRAFASIASPGDRLSIIGSGDRKTELLQLIAELGVSSQVTLAGAVDYSSLPRELAQHDTLVLASESEVWGLVVNEALASGLQCVVGDRCGVGASVQDMRGVYMAQTNIESIAKHMEMSRTDWQGPIANPEILAYTPRRFAGVFGAAIEAALTRTQNRGS